MRPHLRRDRAYAGRRPCFPDAAPRLHNGHLPPRESLLGAASDRVRPRHGSRRRPHPRCRLMDAQTDRLTEASASSGQQALARRFFGLQGATRAGKSHLHRPPVRRGGSWVCSHRDVHTDRRAVWFAGYLDLGHEDADHHQAASTLVIVEAGVLPGAGIGDRDSEPCLARSLRGLRPIHRARRVRSHSLRLHGWQG